MRIEVEMKILVYGAGVMAQYVKESIINSSNEFIGFIDPLGNGDFKNLEIKKLASAAGWRRASAI